MIPAGKKTESSVLQLSSLRMLKKPRRVCARKRKKVEIIFSGGMYVEENTARLANVRRVRRCCRGAPVLSSCQDAETEALSRS